MVDGKMGAIKMTDRVDTSPSQAALAAGFGLLIMAVLAIWVQLIVLPGLVVPGDAATTVKNIMANESLYRISLAGWVIVLICDVVVAWGLYVFLKPVNGSLSLLTAWFRLVYTVIHGATLLNFAFVLLLLSDAAYSKLFEIEQLHGLVSLFLNGREYGFLIGLLFFGIHLLLLGYLVVKSGYVPKILGILLIGGGVGYLSDSLAHVLLPNYADYQAIFLMIGYSTAIGELSLMGWLLWKGVKVQPRDNRALEPATL